MIRLKFLAIFSIIISLLVPATSVAWVKGIYITQPTLEHTRTIKRLVKRAKAVGINTFVIDVQRKSKRYKRNIEIVKKNNLRYVARIVIFPHGGKPSQVQSKKYWDKKLRLIKYALAYGAEEIQLDYIRYYVGHRASSKNEHDIHKVIKYYRKNIPAHIPLQLDVFGVTAHGASRSIGQNLKLFADSVDVIAPMMYPSHYHPIAFHSSRPYKTIRYSMDKLEEQFNGKIPYKVYVFIEVSNYRYRHRGKAKQDYLHKQIRAVQDSNAHGWYAWSPTNKYRALFRVLESYPVR